MGLRVPRKRAPDGIAMFARMQLDVDADAAGDTGVPM
jgi:hypothetical protein